MYDLIDQPAAALGNGSRLILWAMRGWVGALARGVCPPVTLAPAFAKLGLIPVLPDLHRTMALLHGDPEAQLTLAAIEVPHISEDEALLLGLWRDVATGREQAAQAILGLLVAVEGIAPILEAMTGAVAKLADAHLAPTGLSTCPHRAAS